MKLNNVNIYVLTIKQLLNTGIFNNFQNRYIFSNLININCIQS